MKLIVRGRRRGKTTDLVEMFKRNDAACLIVFSQDRKRQIIYDFDLKAREHDIFSISEFERGGAGFRGTQRTYEVALLDDLDMVVSSLLSNPGFHIRDVIASCTGFILQGTSPELPPIDSASKIDPSSVSNAVKKGLDKEIHTPIVRKGHAFFDV